MRRIKTAGLAILFAGLALLLAACGPDHGTIHDKAHSEGYYYTTYQCTIYNKGICTYQMPIQHWQPPTWSFDLYASADDHGWYPVSEGTYVSYEIGDYYPSN